MARLPSRLRFVLEYKPGRINLVADTLSRKSEFATILSHPQSSLLDRIKESLSHDPMTKNMMEYAMEGKTQRFWLEGDLLYTKGRRLYMPLFGNLRRGLLKECHDSQWAGHPVVHHTLALTEENYYWPRMRDDVEAYVKTCRVCQHDKMEQKVLAGLLEPLPIPEQP